jgi:hypothetical protein
MARRKPAPKANPGAIPEAPTHTPSPAAVAAEGGDQASPVSSPESPPEAAVLPESTPDVAEWPKTVVLVNNTSSNQTEPVSRAYATAHERGEPVMVHSPSQWHAAMSNIEQVNSLLPEGQFVALEQVSGQ